MNPTITTLANGARLILAHDPTLRTVAVVPGIHVGSRHEPKPMNGVSHLVEHLIFKGTAKYPTAEILTRTVDRVGGYINASTDRELTNIQVMTARADEMIAADVAMELLGSPLMREDDIERERPVVCDEIKMYEADDGQRAWYLTQKVMFGDHPLGWPVAGYSENIQNVSTDAIRNFRDENYVPGRISVTLAGNYSESVRKYVEERLLALQGSSERRPKTEAPPFVSAPATMVGEALTPRATILLGFDGPREDMRARTAMALLGTLLGGYMSSRLFVELREKQSLCYSVGSSHSPLSDASNLYVSMALEPEHLAKAIASLGVEFRRIFVDLEEDELASAKTNKSGSMAIEDESCLHVATRLTHDTLVRGRIETTDEKVERYNSITLDEVRAATKMFVKNIRTAIVAPADALKGIEELCANELGPIGA